MKSYILPLFLVLTIFAMVSCVKMNATPLLDETALRTNLASQFSQHADMPDVTSESLVVKVQQAVIIEPNTYYAVKIDLAEAYRESESKAFPMTFVTDPSGNLVFNSVINLREGKEAVLSKAPEVTRLIFPASVIPSTFITGGGDTDVIFIADPFCSYCRKGYVFLSKILTISKPSDWRTILSTPQMGQLSRHG